MNNDKRIIDIICDSLLPLAFLFLVVICIIILFTVPVHAASDQDYFPMEQNKNGVIPDNILNYLDNNYASTYYTFCYFEKREANDFQPGHYYYYYRVVLYPLASGDNIYGEINNDLIHFSLYALDNNGVLFRRLSYYDNTPNNITAANNGSFAQFQNLVSSNYDTTKDYVSNFQVYTNNNPATRKKVLLYGIQDPVINDDDTIPEDSPKPDLENYLPEDTTPPTFDNSSVEAALGSIFNYIQYQTNKIAGTISGIGEYISDSIMWGLQMVINNIRSKITEMVNAIGDKIDEVKVGIGSVVDNIEDFFDYIKEPVDKQAIDTALEGTTLYSVSNIGSTIKNTFTDYFDSIPQPDTLVFSIPYTILTKSGYITIDFSWYAGIRSSVLPWIVGFLYAGFGLFIFRSIPSIIHGVSGVLQKGG